MDCTRSDAARLLRGLFLRPSFSVIRSFSRLTKPGIQTRVVDVFSLGCIYYYVLTLGVHPFGDSLRRQLNIVSGQCSLKELEIGTDSHKTAAGLCSSDLRLAVALIRQMVDKDVVWRASADDVCRHPFFWNKAKQLAFFLVRLPLL